MIPESDLEYDEGVGVPILFASANGFPPLCYRPLLDLLAENQRVLAPTPPYFGRPTPPPKQYLWRDVGADYAALVRTWNEKPVAMGHSLGATSLLDAAAGDRDLFRALVLIEPVTVSPALSNLLRLSPRWFRNLVPPARATRRKRRQWSSREEFLKSCERSGFYKRFSSDAMEALANGSLRPSTSGVELRFDGEWETHFFTIPASILRELSTIEIPLLIIRGKPSFFLDDSRWDAMQKSNRSARFEQIPSGGHLLPLEEPEKTAAIVTDFIQTLD